MILKEQYLSPGIPQDLEVITVTVEESTVADIEDYPQESILEVKL